MSRILLTGVSGLVGRAVHERLSISPINELVAVLRTPVNDLPESTVVAKVADIDGNTAWGDALGGCSAVVHAAARVHVMNETSSDSLRDFRRVNVEGSLNLARQAAQAGVRRFVFISSIKVNGEGTVPGAPYFADAEPAPADSYGISKMEAEQGLREIARKTGMEVVIIRPTLVYGPGVKANFLNMMRWLNKGVPLPLGAINNRRSLVALGNLVDLVVTCLSHPAAANQTFLVSDGEDLSTTELLRRMGQALGSPARLLPVPSWMLETGATLLGRKALSQRLCGSLQVDISKTRELLGWTPPLSVDAALRVTAQHFIEQRK